MKTMWYLTWPLWPITSLRQPGATDSLTLLLVIFSFTHVYKVYQVPFLAGDGFRFSKGLLLHLRAHKLFQKTTWKKKTSQVLGTKFGNGGLAFTVLFPSNIKVELKFCLCIGKLIVATCR